jgi:hypothetical protein
MYAVSPVSGQGLVVEYCEECKDEKFLDYLSDY